MKNIELPDFSRIPIRAPEPAVYRPDGPPRAANNPLYLALPAPRSQAEVKSLIENRSPKLEPGIRDKSAAERRERIDDVHSALFALPVHVELEEMLMSTIRNSYADRGWTFETMEGGAAKARMAYAPGSGGNSSVGSGSFSGPPGIGKSAIIIQLLMACPQVILHTSFKGQQVGVQQLVWLYVSMPARSTAFGLLVHIAAVLDKIFNEGLVDRISNRHLNLVIRARMVAHALAMHVTGVVVVDELHNIKVGTPLERQTVETLLKELINSTYTRFVFVGSAVAFEEIENKELKRRMVGERGKIVWRPFEFAECRRFLRAMNDWTVTSKSTEITDPIVHTALRVCGGIPDTIKKLITAAESLIIGHPLHPDEQLTPTILEDTMKSRFPDLLKANEAEFRRQQRIEAARRERAAQEEANSKKKSSLAPDANPSPKPARGERDSEDPGTLQTLDVGALIS